MATIGDDTETVSKADYNKLKRKLQETESKWRADQKKLKHLKTLVSKGFRFPTKRAQIRMTLPDFVKSIEQKEKAGEEFSVCSDPVEIAGFQWKLEAHCDDAAFGFYLSAIPPDTYEGTFEFEVDYSVRLFGNIPSHDVYESANDFTNDDDPLEVLVLNFPKMGEMLILDSFVRADGSVQVELDFVIQSATLYADDFEENSDDDGEENGESGNKGKENAGEEAGKK